MSACGPNPPQIAYTQQTLLPDVAAFVQVVRASLGPGSGTIVIDGSHAFGAVPTVLYFARLSMCT